MFLPDTNVVSELLRPLPEPVVKTWVGNRSATNRYFSAIGEAELRYGVAILPSGRHQTARASAIEAIQREDFHERVLPFDSEAARAYADIAALRRSAGLSIAPSECQIPAIARSRGMALVTRNVRDFKGVGLELVDPWTTG